MSHKKSVTPSESSPPQRATWNARLHPAVSQNGYFPTKKYRSSTPPAMEQRQTSSTQKGYPTPPSPDPTTFNKKFYTLIIIEIGFCRDLGCNTKLEAKTAKYALLLAALRRHWGRVEFVAFPIGHAGVTLHKTLTTAFSAVRPQEEPPRDNRGTTDPATDHNAKTHD